MKIKIVINYVKLNFCRSDDDNNLNLLILVDKRKATANTGLKFKIFVNETNISIINFNTAAGVISEITFLNAVFGRSMNS